MKRRTIIKAAGLGLAGAFTGLPALAQDQFGSKELIAAAEKEGGLTYYTANFAETEQEVIKEFKRTFPRSRSMVRAPGGQLITRIKTEAAAGKLGADVVNHSDRGLMLALVDLFQDYAPPNAADYRPDALVSPKLWPGVTLGWAIAYNTQLVKNAPKTWMDLLKPEYKGKQIGQVVGPSGGTTWTRAMFERQVLGEDYWEKQAALGIALYPSGRRCPRWCVARCRSPAALQHHLHQDVSARRGNLRTRGRADHSYADGIPTAKS
jgi:iron(III) transport system substrate-binding protein